MPLTTALVLQKADGQLSLQDINFGPVQSDEALVEIHATGICHTDLSCATGVIPVQLPAVLGHEGAGVVLEVGAAVTDVAVGDKVLLSYSYCGACAQCVSGHAPYCQNLFALNFGGQRQDGTTAFTSDDGTILHSHFFGQSSFSRKAVVRRTSIVKVPQDVSLHLYASLGCGLQTGAGAVLNTLDVRQGSTVAIFGIGSVGLSAVMAAAIRGAREIIAIDIQPGRLLLAKELGATTTINSLDVDVLERIKTVCPPSGVQFALDCSGIPTVIETMVDCLGPRGRGCSVGAPAPGKRASIDVFSHLTMGREYVGCHQGEAYAQQMATYLIEQNRLGKYPLEKLIKTYAVKDFDQAIKDMKEGKTVKPVLLW